jgi:hypothetical protein
MLSIRRYYHRRFGYHGRFHLAVILTIVAVAYVAVPHVARLVETIGGYNPGDYEPKDFERAEWLSSRGPDALIARITWDGVVQVALFLLVAVVWLTLVPDRGSRRRSPRR